MTGATMQQPKSAPRRGVQRAARRRRGIRGLFARIRPLEAEGLLILVLFGFALLLRWPNLMRLPHFTDEIGEIRWALRIYNGETFPLTAQVKYFGPLHHYILAACLRIFGPSLTLPRTLVCIFGGLTVVMTYLVGREIGGWRLGALGAAFLATLPQHIVVNSHVAWENSTTPFYATLVFYTFLRAIRALPGQDTPARRYTPAARWLIACGFCGGLMLQTHVGTVVVAPALALAFIVALRRKRAWALLRSPWLYASPVAAVLAYAPVLIANVSDGMSGFRRAQGRDYAFVADPTVNTYFYNLRNFLFQLARMISNPFRTPERALHYLTSPYMLIAVGLALFGLLLLARRGQPLPLLAVLSAALTMPYFNHAYGVDGDRYLLTGRYVAFLLPPLTIAVAAGALALARWGMRQAARGTNALTTHRAADASRPESTSHIPYPAFAILPALLILALLLYPIIPLRRYYTHESQLDPDNATFLETVEFVKRVRGTSNAPVMIGPLFRKVDLKDGADALDILDILLTLERVPHKIVDNPSVDIAAIGDPIEPSNVAEQPIVIMMRDECFPIRETAPLLRLSGRYRLRELYWDSPSYFGVYRYQRDLLPGGRCLPTEGATPGD